MAMSWLLLVVVLLLHCSDEPGKPCREERDVEEPRHIKEAAQVAPQSQVTR